MNTIKFQNYLHYKLPITTNPLEYGKLIEHFNNKYIMQLSTANVVVINQINDENLVKFFRKGELMFEYKDLIKSDSTFIRTINDQRYTFKDNKLISTQISISNVLKTNYNSITPLYEDTNSIQLTPFFIQKRNYSINSNIIKLRKIGQRNVWNIIELSFSNKLFKISLFKSKFNKFWNTILTNFNDNNHMFILFKIKYVNNEIATIGNLQRLSNQDKDWYINWIINNMEFKSEYYNETQIESFIISYGFKSGKIKSKNIIKSDLNFQNYKNNNLVISYNPLDYGILINKITLKDSVVHFLQDKNGLTISFRSFEEYNQVEFFKDGTSLIKFTDFKITMDRFVRIIDNKKYYFENNQQILFCEENKSKFISKLEKSNKLINNFITLDIETYVKDNILIPFCISIYDGKGSYSYILSDFKDSKSLILTALKSILMRKYNGYNVYIHNMGKFDIIFLLKYLIKLGNVKPIIHNNRIISINLNFGKDNEYRLQFKDSYLLLLASLAKLTKGFEVETLKSIFPFLFVNENNLDYIGEVPDFKYFGNKITKNDYNNYISKFDNNWNLRNEAIKYCEIDCISLYQVIFKFTEMIFDLFGKNVHHYPTLPSLAFAIFRSNFMEKDVIPQLSGKIAKDIRESYTGGAVDMYIPKLPKDVKGFVYDVNSLYPSRMQECFMPVGNPTYFEGDIRSIDPNAFGFFYCKIKAPDNIQHPILQTHVKTHGGIRTISPIGNWEGMLFSEEVNNALKYGYEFNILWGYTFERKNVFKDYIDFLYNLRLQYPKSHPLNFIAKILLNSLYGRLGMDDNFSDINIIHKDYISDFENKYFELISSRTELDDYFLIEVKNEEIIEDDNSNHNINVAISSAITAYARIHMSQFKNNPNINLYYTDTDSIYVDKELSDDLVNNKILGKMKIAFFILFFLLINKVILDNFKHQVEFIN